MNSSTALTPERYGSVIDAGALLAQGIQSGLSVDALERLLSMRRELKAEESRAEFFTALSRFQSQIPAIPKNQVTKIASSKGNFSYRYADLADIQRAIAPRMADCGLSITFDTTQDQGGYVIQAKVHHIGGHSETTTFRVPVDTTARMNSTQAAGSALTYGRRYALTAALGIVTAEDDDDGHSLNAGPVHTGSARPVQPAAPTAPDPKPAPIRAAPPEQSNGATITAKQHTLLEAQITRLTLDRERVKSWVHRAWGVEHLDQIPAARLNELLNRLGAWHQAAQPIAQPIMDLDPSLEADADWFAS